MMRFLFKLLLALFGLLAMVIVFMAWQYFQPSTDSIAFNERNWKQFETLYQSVGDPGCYRGGMALDLIEKDTLIGKQQVQILQLLGQPASESASSLVYEVGQCSGFGWEDSQLIVQFNESGTVKHASFERVTW